MGNWIHFGTKRCQKYALHKKKASNESCSDINLVRKSPRVHMSISPGSEARGLQRSVYLKSYNVQKWNIRFILGLNDAKNTQCIKKSLK